MKPFQEKLQPPWKSLFIGFLVINIYIIIDGSWAILFIITIILAVLTYVKLDITLPVAFLLAFLGSVVSQENHVVSLKDLSTKKEKKKQKKKEIEIVYYYYHLKL